jgi:hypothetical protein
LEARGFDPHITTVRHKHDQPEMPAAPTRFNPGQAAKTPFEVLYLAENLLVAFREVLQPDTLRRAQPSPPLTEKSNMRQFLCNWQRAFADHSG